MRLRGNPGSSEMMKALWRSPGRMAELLGGRGSELSVGVCMFWSNHSGRFRSRGQKGLGLRWKAEDQIKHLQRHVGFVFAFTSRNGRVVQHTTFQLRSTHVMHTTSFHIYLFSATPQPRQHVIHDHHSLYSTNNTPVIHKLTFFS